MGGSGIAINRDRTSVTRIGDRNLNKGLWQKVETRDDKDRTRSHTGLGTGDQWTGTRELDLRPEIGDHKLKNWDRLLGSEALDMT